MITSEYRVNNKVLANISKIDGIIESELEQTIKDIKKDMNTSKSGETHFGKKRSSGPGESPAVQSGSLIKSLSWRKLQKNKFIIKASDKKAYLLEFGTPKMAARPFFMRFIMKHFEKMVERITELFRG
jgi:hypothetical protein